MSESGRQFLGPGVREVVDMLGDPTKTVDLKDLAPGDRLFVKVWDEPRDMFDFTIVEPAKDKCDGVEDSARALLPGWKFSDEYGEEQVKILIGGSCTFNPSSPLGITMLSIGRLTTGRNLIMWLDGTDEVLILKTPIEKITILKVDR